MAVPPHVGWLCHSPLLTAAMSLVFISVLTPGWWSTLRRWLWPSQDRSSAPSRSRASWDLQEPLKLELALVLPVLLGAHMFMVAPGGDEAIQLEAVDHAKPSELLLKEECPGDDKQDVPMWPSSRAQHLGKLEHLGLPLNASEDAQIFWKIHLHPSQMTVPDLLFWMPS